jgi:hypothetical protein
MFGRGGRAMQTPTFTIGGTPIPFAAAWVHLKPHPHEPTGYEVGVPRSLWSDVFDPDTEQAGSLNWPEFLRSDVEELGTGMVQIWFNKLSKYSPSDVRHWEWVIATVDQITEHEDQIRIAGRAERFEPWRFAEPLYGLE